MSYFLLVSAALALAVTVNCLSVYAQKRYAFYDRYAHGWLIHSLLIAAPWVLFVILASQINDYTKSDFQSVRWLGLAVSGVAVAMFVLAIRKVGTQALSNGNFFGKGRITSTGIYKYLSNPIYDSYWLCLIGAGLFWGNSIFFVIAGECFVGLNIIEAHVERPNTSNVAVME